MEEKDLLVVADKEQKSRVLFNLLNNAIKFTDNGDIFITLEKTNSRKIKDMDDIHGKVQKEGIDYIIVKIKDLGFGIDSEIMLRLFSNFASKSFQGTGLGLYIFKSIIEAHGGKIWLKTMKKEKARRFLLACL